MSDMKCPICETILDKAFINNKIRGCPKCRNMGNIELWQELIRTRKALDVAIRGLDQMTWGCDSTDAEYLLKEIKEQHWNKRISDDYSFNK